MMKLSAMVPAFDLEPSAIDICTFRDDEDAKKCLTVTSTRYGTLSGEIKISYDTSTMCMLDIVDALSDKRFRKHLEELRIIGSGMPIELTEAEKMMIYDHKHDEEGPLPAPPLGECPDQDE